MTKRAVACIVALFLAAAANGVEPLEDIFEENYALDSDGAISITNTDGSIRIYAADVDEIQVRAIKKAYTAARLNGIEVVANATPKSLVIETRYPAKESGLFADKSGTVDYMLIVPMRTNIATCDLSAGEVLIEGLQEGSVKAHLVNGWLAVHNTFVDVDASIVNGKLDLAYDWWLDVKPFVAHGRSVNGSVRAVIPPEGTVTISAASENGKVANTFDESDTKAANTSSLETMIGSGKSATIILHSTNGNIRIDRPY